MDIEGKLVIEHGGLEFEYEPSAMTGAGTIFLRTAGIPHNVPMHISKIDSAIEILQRLKKTIETLEADLPQNPQRGAL